MKKGMLDEVVEKLSPTEQELAKVNETVGKLFKLLKNKDMTPVLGGSYAKKTAIRKKTKDVDVFVAFDYAKFSGKSDKLSELLFRLLRKKKLKVTRLKGSRDYFSCSLNGIKFEIVPILKIKRAGQSRNITDISPLHVSYIQKEVQKRKNLAKEIILGKAFAYSSDCYGAESYISGFSGYALEVLIAYYGSFMKFIRTGSKWFSNGKVVIDPSKYYKNKKEVQNRINMSKLQSPLILVDPVQKERNVTAALSKEKLLEFSKSCKKFLVRPSDKFFFKEKFDIPSKAIVIDVSTSRGKEDVVGAKLLKFFDNISRELEREGFGISKRDWRFFSEKNNGVFYFVVKNPVLGKYKIVGGPPVKMERHAKRFRRKYKSVSLTRGRLYSKVKRKYVKAGEFIRKIVRKKPKYIKTVKVK